MDDALLLARVAALMGVMPVLLKLPLPRVLAWLEQISRFASVGEPARVERVVRYCRAMGTLRRWSFQDNCVARSLTLFALLHRPGAPVDVVFGVFAGDGSGNVVPGRTHVWLERAGAPLLETEPVHQYAVTLRHQPGRLAPGHASSSVSPAAGHGEGRLMWSAAGLGAIAVLSLAGTGVLRTKAIASFLGPAGLGLHGQVVTLIVVLTHLTNFAAGSGTTRFLREALAAGDAGQAAGVVRTTLKLQAAITVTLAAALIAWAGPVAAFVFGGDARWTWTLWLVPALPMAAACALGASVLRASRAVTELAVLQAAGGVAYLAAVVVLVARGPATVVLAFPAVATATQLAATAIAGHRTLAAAARGARGHAPAALPRRLLAYGTSALVTALSSSLLTLGVGRSLLVRGDAAGAGLYFALAGAAEWLLSLSLAGSQSYLFPTLCGTPEAEATRTLRRWLRSVQLVTVLALALVQVFAPALIPLLLSDEFTPIVPLVGWLVLGVYLRSLAAVLGVWFHARGHLAALVLLHVGWVAGVAVIYAALGVEGGAANWVTALIIASALHVIALAVTARAVARLHLGPTDLAWTAGGALVLLGLAL
jgi:O-antigen/teichoic acid export membrane protein